MPKSVRAIEAIGDGGSTLNSGIEKLFPSPLANRFTAGTAGVTAGTGLGLGTLTGAGLVATGVTGVGVTGVEAIGGELNAELVGPVTEGAGAGDGNCGEDGGLLAASEF